MTKMHVPLIHYLLLCNVSQSKMSSL